MNRLALVLLTSLIAPGQAIAYSVLAHEANVDAAWDSAIAPLLRERFPGTTPEELTHARAFAYGGCIIQDLGYYPFGSHLFSNLVHYVRAGDFVQALLRDAQDINQYAFALGALAHYAADNAGHPMGVNRAVPLMYPKLKARYGNEVTYAQSPGTHILVEFSFDVVQAAAGAYRSETYHNFIGFEVAKPVLERAFKETYGLEMKDIFFSEDLAIATYRHAVSTTIPEITKVAWRDKRDEIAKLMPGIERKQFVFNLPRKQYEKDFGTDYQRPSLFARILAFIFKHLPKIGPLKVLTFRTPTPQAESLFLASFKSSQDRFRESLEALRDGRLHLQNTDFDTGKPSALGEYPLADDTYADLLNKLFDRKFADVPDELRENVVVYYGPAPSLPSHTRRERERSEKVRQQLASLTATCAGDCRSKAASAPPTPR
jgi:hypothetical protein